MDREKELYSVCRYDGRDAYYRHAVIRSQHELCERLIDEVIAIAEAFAFTHSGLFAIRLALEEALTNAIKHGNSRNPRDSIEVEYSFTAKEFRVRITDDGGGFDPQAVPDPTVWPHLEKESGRGLSLMRRFMTGVRHNQRGNSVEMWLTQSELANDRSHHN